MGKYGSLAKNSLFVFIGNIGSKMIGFLMLPFYTSWLAVEEYGTADMVTVYVSLLLPFVSYSLCSAIFALPVGREKKRQGEYFTIGLVFVLLSIFLFASVAMPLSKLGFLGSNVFSTYTLYISILLLTSFVQTYIHQFCMAINKMAFFSFAGVVLAATTAIFGFLMIPNHGVEGFLKSQILANIVTIIFSFIVMRLHEYVVFGKLRFDLLKEMLKYSIPMIPNSLLWWVIASFNRVTMEAYIGVYYLGLYAIASKLPSILTSLINPITNAWKLSVVQDYKKNDFSDYYSKVSQFLIMTVSMMVLLIGLLSELIIIIVSDEDFHQSWIYSPILLISIIFVFLDQMDAPIFMAYRKTKYFLYSSIWGALSGVILNYLLIPMIGIWGAVISMVGGHALMSLIQLQFSWKYAQIHSIITIFLFVIIVVICNSMLSILQNYYISIGLTLFALSFYLFFNWKYIGIAYKTVVSRMFKNIKQ